MQRSDDFNMSNRKKMAIAAVFTTAIVAAVVILIMLFPGGGRTKEVRAEIKDIEAEFQELSIRANNSWKAQASPPPRVILTVLDKDGTSATRVVKMHYRGWPWFEDSSAGCAKLWRAILGKDLIVGNSKVKSYFYNDRDMPRGGKSDACRFVAKTGDGFDYFVVNGRVESL